MTYYEDNKEKIIEYQKEYNRSKPIHEKRNYDKMYYQLVRRHKLYPNPKRNTIKIKENNSEENKKIKPVFIKQTEPFKITVTTCVNDLIVEI